MTDKSWDIKPQYDKNVLMGNWFEERLKYNKNRFSHNSTHRTDFVTRTVTLPDVNQRLKYWVRGGGLDKQHILGHHGNAHMHNLITWYDEDYNKRERTGRNVLPESRQWDSGTLAWRPEKRDFPIQGEGTKWGFYEDKSRQWKRDHLLTMHTDFNTTYCSSYTPPPVSALLASRRAPYLERSLRLHPLNTSTTENKKVMPDNLGNLDVVAV